MGCHSVSCVDVIETRKCVSSIVLVVIVEVPDRRSKCNIVLSVGL